MFLGLLGCGGGVDRQAVNPVAGVSETAGIEAPRLTLYTWGEYVSLEVLNLFKDETGIEVEYLTFGDSEEMFSEMEENPERFDVVILESVDIDELAEQGMLQPLEQELLPNLNGVGERFKGESGGIEAEFSIPYLWGTTVVAYRESMTGRPTGSWSMVFEPAGDYPVAVLTDSADLWGAALHYLGAAKAPWSFEKLKLAEAALLGLAETAEVKFTDDLGAVEALEQGEVGAAIVYSGDAAMLADENEEIDYFIPREGAQVWTDVAALSSGCDAPERAHVFLNFLMRRDIAAMTAEEMYYATPVPAAMDLIDPELLADGRIYPTEDTLKRCEELPQISHEQRALMSAATGRMKRAAEAQLSAKTE